MIIFLKLVNIFDQSRRALGQFIDGLVKLWLLDAPSTIELIFERVNRAKYLNNDVNLFC